MKLQLSTPLRDFAGVGPVYERRLAALDISTVRDLLFHFPHRYEDFSRVVPIASLAPGEPVSVHGVLRTIRNRRSWKSKRFITDAIVEDETGAIPVVWFNQPYLTKSLSAGQAIAIAGKPSLDSKGKLSFVGPEFERGPGYIHTSRLVPVYPETRGISSKWLRWKISSFLPLVSDQIKEDLPDEVISEHSLLPKLQALSFIHFPANHSQITQARKRFSFADLLKVRLRVLLDKEAQQRQVTRNISFDEQFVKTLVQSFGFALTQDQRTVTWKLLKDLAKPHPTARLLEGDVGTGKTLVALIASALVAHNGYQAALLAPTEILAAQHFETFTKLLAPFDIALGLLTRGLVRLYDPLVAHVRELSATQLRQKVASNEVSILIGTHAILTTNNQQLTTNNTEINEFVSPPSSEINLLKRKSFSTPFKNLAFVVIDEQHRFGVTQRSQLLAEIASKPHFLTMSATPIPRSLALTIYGNLELSVLKTFPLGERKVLTRVVTPSKRNEAYEFIREKLRQAQQVYVICPVIEESEKLDTKAAMEEYKHLQKIFPEYSVGLLHGRMKSKEKEEIMRRFLERDIAILVATSVVEVGVDVPGATIMLIEGAERFGLSQIHQLRGRIARRGQVGHCLLFTNSRSRSTAMRLKALSMSNDGFYLAQQDLEIRGPGQLLGTRQAGLSDIAMQALSDTPLLEQVSITAKALLAQSPDLGRYPLLKQEIFEQYATLHLE